MQNQEIMLEDAIYIESLRNRDVHWIRIVSCRRKTDRQFSSK